MASKVEDIGSKVNVQVDNNPALAADADAAVAAAAGLRIVGYSCRESAGSEAVATFRIMHGATVTGGTVVFNEELAASKSNTEWTWPGIPCPNGISIDRIAGTVDVDIFYYEI